MRTIRTESTMTTCRTCSVRYEPAGRSAECPHDPTEPEPEYFRKLRALGPPYRLDPPTVAETIEPEQAAAL